MGKQEVAFSNHIVRALLDLHQKIAEIKYLYLKIVESHSIRQISKVELKGMIVELASSLNEFCNDLRFKKISKFNIDDVEKSVEKFIKQIGKRIGKVRKTGLKLTSASVRLDRIPAGEAEIDGALLSNRVFEEQALEKDKLDYLNAIKSFLVEATGGSRDREEKTAARASRTDKALLELKIRNYTEILSSYSSSNLDILYKVKTKVEKALRDKLRTNVSSGTRAEPSVLNHNELYLRDHGNGDYSVSFRDRSLGFLLEILPVQSLEGKPRLYRGEISGWAETGPYRVSFFLKDRQEVHGKELSDPLQAGAVAEFLKKAELDQIYSWIRQACEAKASESDHLRQRVEREMREKVSQALDGAL